MWNASDLRNQALACCHGTTIQFYIEGNDKLSCKMYQRSCDSFLGLPFNIASYAALTMMIAQVCKLKVGRLIMTFGDLHIYNNHKEQVENYLMRRDNESPEMSNNEYLADTVEANLWATPALCDECISS